MERFKFRMHLILRFGYVSSHCRSIKLTLTSSLTSLTSEKKGYEKSISTFGHIIINSGLLCGVFSVEVRKYTQMVSYSY